MGKKPVIVCFGFLTAGLVLIGCERGYTGGGGRATPGMLGSNTPTQTPNWNNQPRVASGGNRSTGTMNDLSIRNNPGTSPDMSAGSPSFNGTTTGATKTATNGTYTNSSGNISAPPPPTPVAGTTTSANSLGGSYPQSQNVAPVEYRTSDSGNTRMTAPPQPQIIGDSSQRPTYAAPSGSASNTLPVIETQTPLRGTSPLSVPTQPQ